MHLSLGFAEKFMTAAVRGKARRGGGKHPHNFHKCKTGERRRKSRIESPTPHIFPFYKPVELNYKRWPGPVCSENLPLAGRGQTSATTFLWILQIF